jgi:hypothetical protein
LYIQIIEGIEKILCVGSEIPKSHLVIIGMIPDPKNPELDDRFNKVDTEVKRIVQNAGQTFVNVNRFLCTTLPTEKGGLTIKIINTELYVPRNGSFDVHLNDQGAEAVAKEVAKMVGLIPKSIFGVEKK